MRRPPAVLLLAVGLALGFTAGGGFDTRHRGPTDSPPRAVEHVVVFRPDPDGRPQALSAHRLKVVRAGSAVGERRPNEWCVVLASAGGYDHDAVYYCEQAD